MPDFYHNTSCATVLSLVVITSLHFGSGSSSSNVVGNHPFSQRTIGTDSLPAVLVYNQWDSVSSRLKNEAALKATLHAVPSTVSEWERYRKQLKEKIVRKTGAMLHQNLPLNISETGSVKMQGYTIKNIAFQTRPGVYTTANLYIPEGKGKFPAVIVMMGHSFNGRFYDKYQAVGHSLARNGYVTLCVDPWGSGERTTIHGQYEDHGDENNLGSALMDIGEPQMGLEITDNIRGVDLLCSLPYVDAQNIGATGSSGGGNQTMWLTAMDDRIKAAVPVVSAGTFESYVMGSPCICEVLPDALTFTEEAGVLSLIAPRALKMCNHEKDANAAFNPREMLRSYQNAKPVFKMLGVENNISYEVFNLTHGYWPEDRKSMLEWFNQHLKGRDMRNPIKEPAINNLPDTQLMVYPRGQSDPKVLSTEAYCKQRGNELRRHFLNTQSINVQVKRKALGAILKLKEKSVLKNVHEYGKTAGWSRLALETNDHKAIPVLLRLPSGDRKDFVILCTSEGKQAVSQEVVAELTTSGSGIALVDLSGTGEASSNSLADRDSIGRLRTISRSYLWLGKTLLGEWVKELNVVTLFLKSEYKAQEIRIHGWKEAGLAGLFLSATKGNVDQVILQDAPVSYLFDKREGIEFYSTGIHLPGFLTWGDVSLAAGLSGRKITFTNPVTMSGQKLTKSQLNASVWEFEKVRKLCKLPGKTIFK